MHEFILYRWWGCDGRLLYVGKSVSLYARISSHRRNSEFFAEAATMTIERFPDAGALAEAEVTAIRTEKPLYNRAHSVDAGGKDARTILVLDRAPEPPDTRTGHWEPIDADDLGYNDLVRLSIGDSVFVQGIIDDDWCVEEEEDCGWTVITDTGHVDVLTEFHMGLGVLHEWVCADENDPFRAGILDRYYARLRAAAEARKVA